MKAVVVKLKAVPGFLPVTFAVYVGKRVLKIFLTKQEAQNYAARYNAE